jgi:hypothetical protein
MATAARVFDAPSQQKGPVPAYKIVEVEGPHERPLVVFDEKSKTIIRRVVEEPVMYKVYFPRGHSITKWSLRELEEAGFGDVVPLIQQNLVSGEAEVVEDRRPTVQRVIEKETKR